MLVIATPIADEMASRQMANEVESTVHHVETWKVKNPGQEIQKQLPANLTRKTLMGSFKK